MSRNLFNSVKMTKPNANRFDLTHDVKLSLNMGKLVPVMCEECIPGDRWKIGCQTLLRFAPLIAPVMHRFDVTVHYFFVPSRLLWDKWEKFITNNDGSTLPAFPTVPLDNGRWTGLDDYLGLPRPAVDTPSRDINAMPHAAYQMIYNEYYRDQNLIDPVNFKLSDGDNSANPDLFVLRDRCWEHDYFTSCLPFAQKGQAVPIPLGLTAAPIVLNQAPTPGVQAVVHGALNANPQDFNIDQKAVAPPSASDLFADLEDVTTVGTINELRTSFRLQEWLEKAARGGTRLVEFIRSFFGVKTQDYRLQRPEYITGTKSPVVIGEVLNTTGTDDAPQGNMSGHGVSVTAGKYGSYYCFEHGFVMGIMSVMPKTAYQQGVPKMWWKTTTPFDYFFPQFQNLGEQAVQNKEIYIDQVDIDAQDATFGYVPRYAEYRFANNRVAGDFRNTLNFWHAGRIFGSAPVLDEPFIKSDPTNRIFAVTGGDDLLYAHVLHDVQVTRLMAKYGTPSF